MREEGNRFDGQASLHQHDDFGGCWFLLFLLSLSWSRPQLYLHLLVSLSSSCRRYLSIIDRPALRVLVLLLLDLEVPPLLTCPPPPPPRLRSPQGTPTPAADFYQYGRYERCVKGSMCHAWFCDNPALNGGC